MSHTPTSQRAPPSFCTPQSNRRDSFTSELAAKPTNTDMLKINYLLNPVATDADASRAGTPAYTAAYTPTSAATPTPGPDTPITPASTKQQKNGKDNGIVPSGRPKSPVNYRPYECNSNTHYYDADFRNEMAVQHRAFRICTAGSGGQGLIGDFPKHVPYASEKKGFFSKTGRDAFEVFQYKFFLPGDPNSKDYTVMWDYNIGLMRMTPFFKACGFQKTTPAKALKVNPGLIDLCHSITGGALTAQGYWVPFACARAVCLTFCYEIRWALTPIFGPDFVTQCLPPNHPNYKTFRINSSIVQHAAQEAESWRINASRSVTPADRYSLATYGAGDNQRPLAPTSAPVYTPTQELYPKRQAPEFRLGSPFAHNNQQGYHRSVYHQTPELDDEPVSPKSSPVSRSFPPATSAWTSINRSSNYGSAPPSPPKNTPVNAYTSTHNHRGVTNSPGFRNAAGQRSTSPSQHIPSQKVLDAARPSSRHPPRPRRNQNVSHNRRSEDDDFDSENVVASSSSSEVEAEVEASRGDGIHSDMSIDSDSDNVVTSPPPSPPPRPSKTKKSKRSRRTEDDGDGENGNGGGREPRAKRAKELQWTKADEEAAHILVELNHEDAKLAYLKP